MRSFFVVLTIFLGLSGGDLSAQETKDTIIWEANNDFAAGYFDVFFENNLFYAIPSIYSNNLERIIIDDYNNLDLCQRKWPPELSTLVTVKREDIRRSSVRSEARMYKGEEVIGKLGEVKIDATSGWRVPTLEEMRSGTIATNWQKMLCYDSHIGRKYTRSDFPRYYGPSVITGDTKNHSPSVYDGNYGGHKKGVWEDNITVSDKSIIMLVREPTRIEQIVFNSPGLSYSEKIVEYAKRLTDDLLTPKIDRIEKPDMAAYSTESGHPVHAKPDSQSTGKRTPSPVISDTSVGA